MISAKTVKALQSTPGMQYLLGVRLCNVKQVRERVLDKVNCTIKKP